MSADNGIIIVAGAPGEAPHDCVTDPPVGTGDVVGFDCHAPKPPPPGYELTAEGYVKVDEGYQTTGPGVYAAGYSTAREESVVDAVAGRFIAATKAHISLYPEL